MPSALLGTAGAMAAAALLFLPAASAHSPGGCSLAKKATLPFGDPERTYPIPHGCVRMTVGVEPAQLPIVSVRRHLANGRTVTRSFRAPATNLDATKGVVGTCGLRSWARFIVAYPFVTIILQPLIDEGGELVCDTQIGHELMWTLQLSAGATKGIWFTHAPR